MNSIQASQIMGGNGAKARKASDLYPGAAQTKKHLEEKAQRQEEMAAQQAAAQQAAMQGDMPGGGAGVPDELAAAIDAQAQQDAMNAASGQAKGLYMPQ